MLLGNMAVIAAGIWMRILGDLSGSLYRKENTLKMTGQIDSFHCPFDRSFD